MEFGALKGDEYSNSYFFEKSYKWKGIMVEAEKKYILHLKGFEMQQFTIMPYVLPESKKSSLPLQKLWDGVASLIILMILDGPVQ